MFWGNPHHQWAAGCYQILSERGVTMTCNDKQRSPSSALSALWRKRTSRFQILRLAGSFQSKQKRDQPLQRHHLPLTGASELQFQRQNMQRDITGRWWKMTVIIKQKPTERAFRFQNRDEMSASGGEKYENRMFWSQGWGVDGNYFLNHSNLNSLVLSAGKFWALRCPDSLASHQCISTLRGLFRPVSSYVVIKKPPLTNSWTSTGFRGNRCINSMKIKTK